MRRLALLTFLLLGACKQGEGEYCQVSSDCKDGLVCVSTTMTCGRQTGGGGIDAGIDAEVPDAVPADGPPIDAAPACSDGMDNDTDGDTDFPADQQCTDANDDDEMN